MSHDLPQVALLFDTASSWGRSIISGVGEYCQEHGTWRLCFEQWGTAEAHAIPQNWQGNGIIARVANRQQLKQYQSFNVPIVSISSAYMDASVLATVLIDSSKIARLAADHFLQRGFKHFGFLGLRNQAYCRERLAFFTRYVEQGGGGDCLSLEIDNRVQSTSQAGHSQQAIVQWVAQAPRPFALLAWSDDLGRLAIEACQMAGLRIPEDVAVLGVDNDDLICNLMVPPMSSIELGGHRIGYKAACLLDQAMQSGQPVKPDIYMLNPVGIVSRQSTDLLAVEDEVISKALQFIWHNTHRPIQVEDVLEQLDISRRTFERRFRRVVGRTPAQEIRRMRLETARSLLLDTQLTVNAIAIRCGYEYAEHFITHFGKAFGCSPIQYRQMTRKRYGRLSV